MWGSVGMPLARTERLPRRLWGYKGGNLATKRTRIWVYIPMYEPACEKLRFSEIFQKSIACRGLRASGEQLFSFGLNANSQILIWVV